jgi:uracil-DNA glycosylase
MTDARHKLVRDIEACTICADHLKPPHALGPRPVVRLKPAARVLIIGQAPGTRVHETGIPWNDKSGDRLRHWMGLDHEAFYESPHIAIMPMGFCYPGRQEKGGDNPPRPECAPAWHDQCLKHMPHVALTMLVGAYAQAAYLGERQYRTMTETVQRGYEFGPRFLPTPHPSWRVTGWLKKNPWFEAETLPHLRARIHELLN